MRGLLVVLMLGLLAVMWGQQAPLPGADWVSDWLRVPIHATLLLVALLALAAIGRRWNSAVLAAFAGLLVILATVPDFRLALGYAALLAGTAAVVGAPKAVQLTLPFATIVCALVLIDAVAHEAGYVILLREPRATPTWSRLLIPPPLPIPQLTHQRVNDVDYSVPAQSGMTCWAAPKMCTIHAPMPSVHWCDPQEKEQSGLCRAPR